MEQWEKLHCSKCKSKNLSIYFRYNDKAQTFKHLPTVGFDFISTEYASPTGEVIPVKIYDTAG